MKTKLAKIEMDQFLDIKCPGIAYLLGFIWADGFVSRDDNRIAITMNQNDSPEIIKIITQTGEWRFYYKKHKDHPSWISSVSIAKYDKNLNCFLKENDYCEKSFKSPDKILSKIPENLKHYWWRGYFDGDGCINLTSNHRRASICSTFDQDWTFAEALSLKLGFDFAVEKTKRLNKVSQKENKYSKIHIQNFKSLDLFFSYIYRDYETDKIGFQRKHDKWLIIKQCLLERKPKTSAYKYICFNQGNLKWKANYKKKHLGWFDSEDKAFAAQKKYLTDNNLEMVNLA